MPRSLRARLILILALLIAAATASGFIMFELFEQSTTARIGQAGAVSARACDSIGRAYRFYTAGWKGGAPDLADGIIQRDLTAVVFTALRDRAGIEGGLWQAEAGALAYAFPTYEGSGPKTDVPQAELPRIAAANKAALASDRTLLSEIESRSQTLVIAACPLPGPVAALTAWTLTRVHSLGSTTYWQLSAGLAILCLTVCAASAMVATLVVTWSRHIRRIETALAAPGPQLPALAATGEHELDRIIGALNHARERLLFASAQSERLNRAVTQAERLAAVGRVSAGVAHEIRSPIAAMRLKAEMALPRSEDRKDQALRVVIDQVDRLDALVSRILSVTEREPLRIERVALGTFLATCVNAFRDEMGARQPRLDLDPSVRFALFDPEQMSRAIGNLLANAFQANPNGEITVAAALDAGDMVVSVINEGPAPPEAISDDLFDPFVSGRPEGTGLGLAIVREVASAHDGTADFIHVEGVTTFRIKIPWRDS